MHFLQYVEEHFPQADTRDELVQFLNDAHNSVNVRLGKPSYSIQEHYSMYAPKRKRASAMTSPEFLFIIIILVFVIRSQAFKKFIVS